MRFLISLHINPAVLDALTDEERTAVGDGHGQFEGCEDAVQEAVLAATLQWPSEGVPDNPRGWLTTAAYRRLIDRIRSDHARRERELVLAAEAPPPEVPDRDDTLLLLFLCCHPALTPASRTALTLRAVGALTTAEIARAFLVPEATMAARISRAKQRIRAAGSSTSGWPGTTGSWRCGPTCGRRPATPRGRTPTTGWPRNGPRVSPSAAIWRAGPAACVPEIRRLSPSARNGR